jgi:hypothetical protein
VVLGRIEQCAVHVPKNGASFLSHRFCSCGLLSLYFGRKNAADHRCLPKAYSKHSIYFVTRPFSSSAPYLLSTAGFHRLRCASAPSKNEPLLLRKLNHTENTIWRGTHTWRRALITSTPKACQLDVSFANFSNATEDNRVAVSSR